MVELSHLHSERAGGSGSAGKNHSGLKMNWKTMTSSLVMSPVGSNLSLDLSGTHFPHMLV